jgi:hypothetical protein
VLRVGGGPKRVNIEGCGYIHVSLHENYVLWLVLLSSLEKLAAAEMQKSAE